MGHAASNSNATSVGVFEENIHPLGDYLGEVLLPARRQKTDDNPLIDQQHVGLYQRGLKIGCQMFSREDIVGMTSEDVEVKAKTHNVHLDDARKLHALAVLMYGPSNPVVPVKRDPWLDGDEGRLMAALCEHAYTLETGPGPRQGGTCNPIFSADTPSWVPNLPCLAGTLMGAIKRGLIEVCGADNTGVWPTEKGVNKVMAARG